MNALRLERLAEELRCFSTEEMPDTSPVFEAARRFGFELEPDRNQKARPPFSPAPGEAECYVVQGQTVILKRTGEETNGDYTLIEIESAPLGEMPMRLHKREAEAYLVLEGVYQIRVGGQVHTARPGTFVFTPRCIPHAFRNIGGSPGRLLSITSPAGIEDWYRERGEQVV